MIVVDAGHGGADPGAVGNNIVEKNYNLEVSNYIASRLKELGIPVVQTRTTDETVSPEDRVNRVLNAFGNNPDVIVLSNHINATGGTGAEVVYALRNNDALAKLILNEIAEEGQVIRKYYQRRLPSDPSKDYYFIHRLTGQTQPVLIEYGFLDSTGGDVFRLKNYLLDYGEAVVRAVTRYLGYPYVSPIGVGDVYYTVKVGDSLWSIAQKFGVTVAELRATNKLATDLLSVGQQLIIPVTTPQPPIEPTTYTVKSGDSLWSIAQRFGVTVNELREANNLVTDVLSIGQQLTIPSEIPVEPPVIEPPLVEEIIYSVKGGDSLWTISRQFGVTIDAIRAANNLTTDLLSIGQELIIPTTTLPGLPVEPPTTEPLLYAVQSGDSLWTIAQRFGVTVNEIRQLNNLTTDLLSVGQQLLIPTTLTEIPPETPPITQPLVYTVQSGDSLWTIAQRFGVTVDEIRQLNNLTTSLLSIGQQLLIPIEEDTEVLTYTVKSGDSLWTISREFGVTLNEIRQLNNLTTDLLSIGQQLLIPVNEFRNSEKKLNINRQEPLPELIPPLLVDNLEIYMVKRGDTLSSIARQFGVTVEEIRETNNLITDLIIPGQQLLIPDDELDPLMEFPGIDPVIYIVREGDTLWSIARAFNVTVNEIRKANNLTNDFIRTNQQLVIPTTTIEPPIMEKIIYTVQPNDTLYSIAQKYGVAVDQIKDVNNLIMDLIIPGQQLTILLPIVTGPIIEPIVYTVRRGDTLWSIAKKFNVSVQEIKGINNLEDNLITIGQEMLIPILE